MDNILTRIQRIADAEGISIYALERSIGASKGVISRALSTNTDIQSKWLVQIVEKYPHIDSNWLLSGIGTMLKSTKHNSIPNPVSKEGIPLVYATAIGGFGNNHFSISENQIKERYLIPKFAHKKADFIIEVEGTSMAPEFNNGDLVACAIVTDNTFTQYGKTHVVATINQGILIKRLRKSQNEGFITLSSDNKTYDPFDVPISEITGVALVVGSIALI